MPEITAAAVENVLLRIDRLAAESLVEEILKTEPVMTLFDMFITPAMESIGKKWERGEASLAQVYMSGRMCEQIAQTYAENTENTAVRDKPVAITVLDDYHILGKRVVSAFLRGTGFAVSDYGRTLPQELVELVKSRQPEILLISVLMLPSALKVRTVTEQIRNEMQVPPKIVVGGAPFRFDPDLYREVGADETGDNAGKAIGIVRDFYSGSGGGTKQ